MNQIPFLMIKWPQCLHSSVRSTFRSRAERGIALLLYRRERERAPVVGARNRSTHEANQPTSNWDAARFIVWYTRAN